MKKPNICMLTNLFPPVFGGAEIYASELSKTLAKDGNKVMVLTRRVHNTESHENMNHMKI